MRWLLFIPQAASMLRYLPKDSHVEMRDGVVFCLAYSPAAAPDSLQKLADELYLPLDDDLNRAMRSGKEFEQQVLEEYGNKGRNVIIE